MIKISSDNFFKQSHPPVLLHFEKEDMDNGDGDYVDEMYLDGDQSAIADLVKQYLARFVAPGTLNFTNDSMTGQCKAQPNIKHVFIIKHLHPKMHEEMLKGIRI